jgi:DNA-binding response OmpR family regulator
MKMLIAENNEAYMMMLQQILSKADHEISVTSDGFSALKTYTKDEDIQVVFADWELSGLDGIELSKKIRHIDGVRGKTSYIVLTGDRGGKWDIMQAMDAGANDIITKPYSEEVITDRLKTVMSHFLHPPGEDKPLERDPITHLLEEHKILRFQAKKLNELLEDVDEESNRKLVKWLSGKSFVLETDLHQEKENVFSIAFLERLVNSHGEAVKAISDSSSEWIEKEHKGLVKVVSEVKDNFKEYREALNNPKMVEEKEFNIMNHTDDFPAYCMKCEKKVKIAKVALFQMENDIYAFQGDCAECGTRVNVIIGNSIGEIQKNIKLKRSLKNYLRILKEHLEREEKNYFPLVNRYLTQADRERLMLDFEVIEDKYGIDRMGKDFKFLE